jgi:hypothetical protein
LVWAEVTFQDKLAFFNLWHMLTLVANCCFMISCSQGIVRLQTRAPSERGKISTEQVLRAIGLFTAWVSMIRFFEYFSRFYVLIIAMRASLLPVFRFIMVVFPMYMAYALIGVFSFSEQDDFNNMWRALRTLFALLNGDSILLMYQEVCPSDRSTGIGYCLWGQIYLYTFCVLFITTVLNVFIFIIEAGNPLLVDVSSGGYAARAWGGGGIVRTLPSGHALTLPIPDTRPVSLFPTQAGFDRANTAIRHHEASDEHLQLDHTRLKKVLDAADAVHGALSAPWILPPFPLDLLSSKGRHDAMHGARIGNT